MPITSLAVACIIGLGLFCIGVGLCIGLLAIAGGIAKVATVLEKDDIRSGSG